jgi:hypothetical protein
MSVLRPRNRLVNFRLSEDEFERLKASCSLQNARSISDFARSAVLERMETGAPAPTITTRGHQLDNRVMDLENRVGQLLNLISATGFSSGTPNGTTTETAQPVLVEVRTAQGA